MTTSHTGVVEWTRQRRAALNTNLLNSLTIVQGDLQTLDDDFLALIGTFPYVCDGTSGDWTTAHSGDPIRYDMRMVRSCGGHRFVVTYVCNLCRHFREISRLVEIVLSVCRARLVADKSRRVTTYLIEEIH